GSNVNLHTYKNQLIRVVAGDNDAVNECWISDRDRFSYQGVYAEDRLQTPMIKKEGVWREIDWAGALDSVAELIKAIDNDKIGALVSPRATTEEQYLLQKLLRGVGVNNIDHRLRQSDFYDQDIAPLAPTLGVSIADLEQQHAVLLVGSNIRQEQPMLNHRLRKAALNGAQIMTVNLREYEFNYEVAGQLTGNATEMLERLAGIALASGNVPTELKDLVEGIKPSDAEKQMADHLKQAENALVVTGNLAVSHPQYSVLRALSLTIADNTGAKYGSLVESANSAGGWLAGAVPHRQAAGEKVEPVGKNIGEMLSSALKMYILLDVEPEFDCEDPRQAMSVMNKAECVVAITPYASESLKSYADILLPASSFAETSGSFVNAEGRWQSFAGAASPLGDARPAWKILRVLGNVLEVDGFDYVSSQDVRDELQKRVNAVSDDADTTLMQLYQKQKVGNGLQRISEVAMYCTDSLVRRATALHESLDDEATVRLHIKDAETMGLQTGINVCIKQDNAEAIAKVIVDSMIPEGCVLIPEGTQLSADLGASHGTIKVSAV
ncbi:MAG: molybdopterin-dependent oxidoreductase, partial [Cocleimonas sp.]|nr:molybdopterin-dependent oxidoreductase [Cocleimonas sp.]